MKNIAPRKTLTFNFQKHEKATGLFPRTGNLMFRLKKRALSHELIMANRKLAVQRHEKDERTSELRIANDELGIQNEEKGKRSNELILANWLLKFQKSEKDKRAAELVIANDELAVQNNEKDKRAAELILANTELLFQNEEKEKRAAELVIANRELAFQNQEKEKRASELVIATEELAFHRKKEESRFKLLESVVTNTNDSVIIMDSLSTNNGGPNIIYVNDAFTKLTGYSKEEVLGKQPFFLLGPKSDQYEFERLANAMRKSEPCEIEILQYKKNRDEIWVNLELVQVKDAEGTTTHYIAIQRDITTQINSINSIREQNTKLKDIAWMQSHDVRGPLARILGLTNLMINHPLEEDRQTILNLLLKSSVELDEIITKIILKAQQVQ